MPAPSTVSQKKTQMRCTQRITAPVDSSGRTREEKKRMLGTSPF